MIRPSAIDRRQCLMLVAGSALLATAPRGLSAAADTAIKVYKTPTCGCCSSWVDHLQSNGFEVSAEDLADLDTVKQMAGVPDHLLSCHTGLIGSYTIEGHVPAPAIRKLLAERPKIRGLAVPGMPAGSPGMPSPNPERYDVVAFGGEQDRVFMSFVETDPI
ncbi:MAG: DUF411 domain-containing protein [Geminicoccales bacterium]